MLLNNSKKQVFNHILVLDESGSMGPFQSQVISGVNELLSGLKRLADSDNDYFMTLIVFSDRLRTVFTNQKVNTLGEMESTEYIPGGMTALYDAVGVAISCAKMQSYNTESSELNTVITIFTDGADNSSKEYTQASIAKAISDSKELGYIFTFIGTKDTMGQAKGMGIDAGNILTMDTLEDTQASFRTLTKANTDHSVRRGKGLSGGSYFDTPNNVSSSQDDATRGGAK
jgi:uncharacterized protein YegL